MSRSKNLWITLLLVACTSLASAVQIYQESFEATTGWSVTPAFAIGGTVGDYMMRFDNTAVTVPLATLRGSLDGTWFIGGEDTNGSLPLPADGIYTVTLDPVTVTGYATLTVSIALNGNPVDAYDTASLAGGDYLRVYVNIDGGGDVLVGQFTRVGPTALSNGRLGQDTNLDGFGDVEIPDYFNFNNYTFPVVGSGSSMVIKVVTRFESGNEEIVYDNIRVDGGSSDITPPDLVSVTVISTTELDVDFNEDVEESSAEDPFGYSVNLGVGNPLSAVRDNTDNSLVHLTFSSPIPGGDYTLTANDVEDLAGNPCVNETGSFSIIPTPNAAFGDVVITEVMYDDTASTDNEWVEIYNTTAADIDVSGWILQDDDVYPSNGGEGAIRIPNGSILVVNGFMILCKAPLLDQPFGYVVCTEYVGSWIPSNGATGDNLALYHWHTNGLLIDGSLTDNYPDLAGTNEGNSIEKCDPLSTWSSDPADWTESLNSYSTTGQYRHHTAYFTGFCCNDGVSLGNISLIVAGPPMWAYRLEHVAGCVDEVIFTNFCVGTTGSVDGDALNADWTVVADDGDGDSIFFVADEPLNTGTLDGFQLNHPFCSDEGVGWSAGDNSGYIDGPLPVELLGFTAIAGDHHITLNWNTASEIENDHFDLIRDGALVYRVDGLGTSATGRTYEWTDENVSNGTLYDYSLVAVRTDGSREEVGTVSATPAANNAVITEYALHQNYPNPFNPTTTIYFDLPEATNVTLTVFDIMGREIKQLRNDEPMVMGRHSIDFSAGSLPCGVYFYRLRAGEFVAQEKMLLLK